MLGNPLLATWSGPFGGVPPFDKIRVSDFTAALEVAIAENLREVETIAANHAPPTFDNTLVALERSGQTMNRVAAIYGVWSSAMSTPEFQAVERDMRPKLAAFSDRIYQNTVLFERIAAVYAAREQLPPIARRLC